MVPAYFRKLARLPLNPNGKIDYFGLSAQEPFIDDREAAFEAPFGEMEQKLRRSLPKSSALRASAGGIIFSLSAAIRCWRRKPRRAFANHWESIWNSVLSWKRRQSKRWAGASKRCGSSADAAQSADREEIEL